MIIDILLGITVLLAIFKGWTRGLIVGLFSLLALILGAAAALKLSGSFAVYMAAKTGHPSPLWPVATFILIFLAAALLVRLIARLLEKTLQLAMLGWFNRFCGVILYVAAYITLFSVALWLANQMYLVSPSVKTSSRAYSWVASIGPRAVTFAGDIIPWFKHVFEQLETFFQHLSPLAYG